MKKRWIIMIGLVLAVLCLLGCDGTGGVGGQGICLKDNSDCTVTITISDGGTSMIANPGEPAPAVLPVLCSKPFIHPDLSQA